MPADLQPTQAFVERRRLPRLAFREPIQYRTLLKLHKAYSGSLGFDLSASGTRIVHPAALAREDRLVVLLDLPESRRLIRAVARVAWHRERPFASGYESGLQFIEITPEDRDSIAGRVERGVVS